jgi:hypothetical protein
MFISRKTIFFHRRQAGWALVSMAILLIILMSSWAWYHVKNPRKQAENRSDRTLAQAKQALLAYLIAGNKANSVSTQLQETGSRLPCPDTSGNGQTDAMLCKAKGINIQGLLPWQTLGIPPSQDGYGQCLWYAVSGPVKGTAAGAAATSVNSDDSPYPLAQLSVNDGQQNWPAVAVVFAPGPPLQTQNFGTTSTHQVCALPNQGVADNASYFLEGSNVFTHSERYTNTPAFTQFQANNRFAVNDRLTWISPEEFAYAVTQRAVQFARYTLQQFYNNNGYYPSPATTPRGECASSGSTNKGYLPSGCSPAPAWADFLDDDNWWDKIHYAVSAKCQAGTTLCNGTGPGLFVDGHEAQMVLVARGRALPGQDCSNFTGCIENTQNQAAITDPNNLSYSSPASLNYINSTLNTSQNYTNDLVIYIPL